MEPPNEESASVKKPLPPGTRGLPLLGETLPFIKDMFGFIRKRTARHGPVFRSNVLGSPTVFISGVDVTDAWLDESLVMREGSFPKNVQALFGGRSLPLLDGATHRTRKSLVMQAFRRDALESYLPKLEAAVTRSLARAAGAGREIRWLDELKRLAFEGICETLFGIPPGPEIDAMYADYGELFRGFTALPVDLPGTPYRKALKLAGRILARYEERIRAHAPAAGDGLGRLLAAREGDEKIEPADLKLELHHFVLAGYIIFAELAATATALARLPKVREKAAAEVQRVAPSGALTFQRLRDMPYLHQIVLETKRHCPNVPVSFGRAKRTFELRGYTIPEGWLVFMAVVENNMQDSIYRSPETFDPERFSPERAEHEKHKHAFQPQGAGPELGHRCAGADFSTVFMQVFTALLVRDFKYSLPEQDLSLRCDMIPPEPRDGLLVRLERLTWSQTTADLAAPP